MALDYVARRSKIERFLEGTEARGFFPYVSIRLLYRLKTRHGFPPAASRARADATAPADRPSMKFEYCGRTYLPAGRSEDDLLETS